MASSYFDAQPPSKTTAEVVDSPNAGHKEALQRMGLLTPQISQIIDTNFEEHSSSSDDDSTASDSDDNTQEERSDVKDRNKRDSAVNKLLLYTPSTAQASKPGLATNDSTHLSPHLAKHPRLERFVSLRSSLFSSHIADNMEHFGAEKEATRRAEQEPLHSQNRPRDTDSKKSKRRESLTHRMSNTLRKITSRDVPTMRHIKEESKEPVHGSTADEERKRQDSAQAEDTSASDDEDDEHKSVHDSDVEDLVCWVSRRESQHATGSNTPQPPQQQPEQVEKKLSPLGHQQLDTESSADRSESLAPDDVDDLVEWVHEKQIGEPNKHGKLSDNLPANTSHASTGTGKPEVAGGSDGADEMDRYAHKNQDPNEAALLTPPGDELDQYVHRSHDPNEAAFEIPGDEIRPREPAAPFTAHRPPIDPFRHSGPPGPHSLSHDTIPEDAGEEQEETGEPSVARYRSRGSGVSPTSGAPAFGGAPIVSTPAPIDQASSEPLAHESLHETTTSLATEEDHLSTLPDEDLAQLIRTVTQDQITPEEEMKREAAILKWRLEKDRQEKTGHVDDFHKGSLSEEDIQELLRHASKT